MTEELKRLMVAFVVGGLIAWVYAKLHTRRSVIKNPMAELLFFESMFVVLGIATYLAPGKDPYRWEWMSFIFYAALAYVIRFVYLRRQSGEGKQSPDAKEGLHNSTK